MLILIENLFGFIFFCFPMGKNNWKVLTINSSRDIFPFVQINIHFSVSDQGNDEVMVVSHCVCENMLKISPSNTSLNHFFIYFMISKWNVHYTFNIIQLTQFALYIYIHMSRCMYFMKIDMNRSFDTWNHFYFHFHFPLCFFSFSFLFL